MSTHPRRFGIIGYPLSHSFSPGYFAAKFEREGLHDCRYDAFPLSSLELLSKLLDETPNLFGLNVTIPYKTAVIPMLDDLSEEAKAIGAVNVINIQDGKQTGHNSDVYGFEISLRNFLPSPIPPDLKALVLGTGGAAKAVKFILKKLGIPFQNVSRQPRSQDAIPYEAISAELFQSHRLVINTTPLGMSPDMDTSPTLPYALATPHHYFYDLVYNPPKTQFLALAEAAGSHVQNGLSMLHLQAEKAWQIWNE